MPRKYMLLNLFTVILVIALILTQQAWATPLLDRVAAAANGTSKTTMNYQGYLTDSGGASVNDTVSMIFRIYDVESGGSALWSETQNGVVVSDGLFSVLLGSETPLNESTFHENPSLWLGTTVGSDEEMAPRELLTSAPYAMVSDVPDGSITLAKLADDSVSSAKIQNGHVASVDLQNNAVTTSKLLNGAVTRSKTTIKTFRGSWVNVTQSSNHTFVFTHNLGHTNYTAVCTGEDNGSRGRHLKGGMQAITATQIKYAVSNAGDDGTQTVRAHCLVIPN